MPTQEFIPAVSNDPNEICKNCKFVVDIRTLDNRVKDEHYFCRRYPPVSVVVPKSSFNPRGQAVAPSLEHISPSVGADWTCGEFKWKLAVMQ